MSKQKAVIIDLDGTLCNIEHRKKYIDGSLGKKDWDKFYEGCDKDKINEWCKILVESLEANDIGIIFLTGRPQSYFHRTLNWIIEHFTDSSHGNFYLVMRADKDFRPDYIVKKELYETMIKDECDIMFAVDDRQQVVDMWRDLGIVCLQCDEGKF